MAHERRIAQPKAQRDTASKVVCWLLAARGLPGTHLNEKTAYAISLLDHLPEMVDLHSQVNRQEPSICCWELGSRPGPAIQRRVSRGAHGPAQAPRQGFQG